jgi:hypothetical protein
MPDAPDPSTSRPEHGPTVRPMPARRLRPRSPLAAEATG